MQTILFSFLLILMLLIACAFLWWGLMGKGIFMHAGKDQRSEAVALLRAQRADLRADFEAGLIGEDERKDAEREIEKRVLEETAGRKSGAVSMRFPVAFALSVLAIVLAGASLLYISIGSPQMAFLPSGQGGLMQSDGSIAEHGQENDPEALEAFLQRNPDKERVWILLGRAYAERGVWEKAAQAYRSGILLKGKVSRDPQVLIEYAATLISAPSQQNYRTASEAIELALLINPGNYRAMELRAILSLQTENWRVARESLEFLMQALNSEDPMYRRFAEAASLAAQKERESERINP